MAETRKQPWLFLIGIGEEGSDGLGEEARSIISTADYLIGGKRHLGMIDDAMSPTAERRSWPSPFSSTFSMLATLRGQRVVVLATGDPMHCGIGGTLTRFFDWDDIHVVPHISAYSLAAARLGWPLDKSRCLTIHGRNPAILLAHFLPSEKLIILAKDGSSPSLVADQLVKAGAGDATVTVLEHLGGEKEQVTAWTAVSLREEKPAFAALNTIAVEVPQSFSHWLPLQAGLPDDAYEHDGKITKRDIRASALAKLAPRPNALLWDVGTGCGSIAIEWLRSHPSCQAIGLEPQEKRRAFAKQNADALGVPHLKLIDGMAPDALKDLETPDAVFVGGGLSPDSLNHCLKALKSGGRLVAHAVTLGSEQLLMEFYQRHGGELTQLSISKAVPIGPHQGWKPAMPVTQWLYIKPEDKEVAQ